MKTYVCTWTDARHTNGICGRPIRAIYRRRHPRMRFDRCEKHDTPAARRMADGVEWTREAVA